MNPFSQKQLDSITYKLPSSGGLYAQSNNTDIPLTPYEKNLQKQPAAQPAPETSFVGNAIKGFRAANPGLSTAYDAVTSKPVQDTVGAIGSELKQNYQDQSDPNASFGDKMGKNLATGASIAGKVSGLAYDAAGSILPQGAKDTIGGTMNAAGEAVNQIPGATEALNALNDLMAKHPVLTKFLGGIGQTALNESGMLGGGEAAPLVAKGADTAIQGATDAVSAGVGGVKSAVRATTGVGAKTPEELASQLDSHVRDMTQGATGDASKIDAEAFKTRKGIELMKKESPNIRIPDTSAPLGSGATKPFNPATASPNEVISAVNEFGKNIAQTARDGAQKATDLGHVIDTTPVVSRIQSAIDAGEISKPFGTTLVKQLRAAGDTPIGLHDWLQKLNGQLYNDKGLLVDNNTAHFTDSLAGDIREKLGQVSDRGGYAEAYANNQALKKAFIGIAKKANKSLSIGNITSDAGIDAAFSAITGNPLFMGRTLATSGIKAFFNNMKNQAGMKAFRNAMETASKLPTETAMPSTNVVAPTADQAFTNATRGIKDVTIPNPDGTLKIPSGKTTVGEVPVYNTTDIPVKGTRGGDGKVKIDTSKSNTYYPPTEKLPTIQVNKRATKASQKTTP